MQRAIKSLRSTPAKGLLYGLGGGSSIVLGYKLWQSRQPILLESNENAVAWKSKPTIDSSNTSLSDRLKRAASTQSGTKRDQQNDQAATQAPPPQTKGHSPLDVKGDEDDGNESMAAWQIATSQVFQVCDSFTGFDFSSVKAKLASFVLPHWMFMVPGLLTKLRNELSMAPWSLSWEIWEEAHDPEVNPEILWNAEVRISTDLCKEEQDFLDCRRPITAKALANYLGIAEQEIHPDDVPVIAMCGSGGGLRALVAGASSYLSAHEAGLYDCVTYTAGVSGSCWLQTLYYSSIANLSHQQLIDHLKQRIGVHIAYPPAALNLFNQAPTNKFLLSGFVEKLKGVPDADFGIVDAYGLLLAARLMVPKGELRVSDYDLKISNQRYYIEDGAQPLPIYTAVRHEIPDDLGNTETTRKDAQSNVKPHDWFQWFEWTPYELFCEELNAGIPTWAMGRRFDNGQSIWRDNGLALPELRVPLMLGIWGSAFCATLSHYYREIRPIVKAAGLGQLDAALEEKDQDLVKVHPIDPAVIPNFALGLKHKLPSTVPKSIHESSHLQLMDAGMSNNLPIYPLLRPGRNVDVIIAFDASADVRTDNWVKVVDGYAKQRGIKGWPMGAGWPPADEPTEQIKEEMEMAEKASAAHSSQILEKVQTKGASRAEDLGPCTVWVGTTHEDGEYMDKPPTRRLGRDEFDSQHLLSPDAGIALIYFPFLKNDTVPGVDPMHSDFMSTWNFVYTPDEIDAVVRLARANFDAGREQTQKTIRAVWERKRSARLEREEREREDLLRARMRAGSAAAHRNGDVGHGDQFGGGI